ncbi:MAG: DNA polymerase I [Schleiferiaceae bacterium]|nr:DNA polymerase I [Schleiferiaceae bacterium]
MDNQRPQLFLLDAYALIFRAYFAFAKNPRVTSNGLDTSAIFGFTTTLLEILEKENPSHIAVVFDTDKPTQRHIDFEAYKAQRNETPEGIKVAVPYIHKILEGFNIPSLFVEGFEADDVIGTLAKKAEQAGYDVYMMTPDKDFGQLVSPHIKMYKPARGGAGPEIWGPEEVCEKFEIEQVSQVIDYLGMVGDAADNIPGLPGVGDKTAKKFLKEYGTLENLLDNADQIKGKLGEKIRENKELGLLSKKLATIIIDVPIDFDEKAVLKEAPNREILEQLFSELEFRTLGRRILGKDVPQKNVQKSNNSSDQLGLFDTPAEDTTGMEETSVLDITKVPHHYQLIDDPIGIKQLVKKLLEQKSVAFDTETTALEALDAALVGLSFAYEKGKAYYVPCPSDRQSCLELLEHFQPFFQATTIQKVGQNLKYDLTVLANYGISVQGPFFDTMIAGYLIEPDRKHNMDDMALFYLNYQPISITTLIGKKGKGQLNMRDISPEKVTDYAAEDADITLQLKDVLAPIVTKDGLQSIFDDFDVPLVTVLASMEREGIRIDDKALAIFSEELGAEIDTLEKAVLEFASPGFNLSSPKQLGVLLFEKLKLVEKPKKTKTGQYQTSEDILLSLKGKHEIVDYILEHRQLVKLKSTYVDALPALIRRDTGRVHTTFNQTVAATGRLSSTSPNLQNIPIRTERGRAVRKAFVPRDENHVLLAADYSQIELRVIAALSKDEAMIEAFANGLDIHSATASKVFGVPLDSVTKDQRSNAKTVNFGIIYGVSAFGLSQQTALNRTEAKEVIESYFATYPGIKSYMDRQIAFAREHGYVETLFGRRRYLRDINSRNAVVRGHSERNAINAPIQGTAADILKLAMIRIHKKLTELGLATKMLLQVHDELVFDVPKEEVETIKNLVIQEMETATQLSVPLVVEVGIGENWLVAH